MPEDNKINEVIINGQVVMTTRGDTVSETNLLQGETATNRAGEKIRGALDPVQEQDFEEFKEEVENSLDSLNEDLKGKYYSIEDDVDEIDNTDYIPFHDVSDNSIPKKKTLFSSIVEKLKSVFATKTGNNITDIDTFKQNIHSLEWIGTNIPDNSDLDTYTTAGNYRVISDASGATIDNLPLALCGKVIVFDNGNGGIEQFYLANHSPRIYTRTKFGNDAWSNWLEITASGKAHSYEIGVNIPASADMNTYTTEGVYVIADGTTASSISNLPAPYSGKVVVDKIKNNNTDRRQVYLPYNSVNRYERCTIDSGTTWTDWKQIAFTSNLKPHTYEVGTEIPANADMNTYTTEGVYYITGSNVSTITNRPNSTACKVIVMYGNNPNSKLQYWIGIDGTILIRRTYDNGSNWNAWSRFATTGDISPSMVGNGYAVATVSGSAISATITGFQLRAGVIVSIDIPSHMTSACTLNINSTGAKTVYMWSGRNPSYGYPLVVGTWTFIYDGTYYRTLAFNRTPSIGLQDYTSGTNGSIYLDWGLNNDRAQLKYNIANGKLVFNYYKNSYWRGDRELFQNNWSNELILYKETTNSEDGYARISAHFKDTENNKEVTHEIIKIYKDHQASPYDINGLNMVMQSGGQMIIGSGESAQALYGVLTDKTGEKLYLISDDSIFIEANGQTIANRKGFALNTAGSIYPISAETPAVGQGEIGVVDYPFSNLHLNNSVYVERKDWDFKQSNNGISSDSYIFAICSRDKQNLANMRLVGGALTNGSTCAQFRLRNFNSSGETVVDGGIDMYANKSGAFWYWVKAPNNFLASLGTGYAYCSTAESTTAKVASMSYYTLAVNGYVTVYFQYNVPANATLNINNAGAKAIYWRSNAIGANIIRAGDKATFIYYDNKYQLLSLDRDITNGVSTYIYSNSSSGAVIHLKGVQTLQTFTLAVGTYFVTYREQSNPASTDSIGVAFSSTKKTASNQFSIADGVFHTFARANVLQTIQFTKPINVTASTTFYLQHTWNGSANLTSAYACLEISRIG